MKHLLLAAAAAILALGVFAACEDDAEKAVTMKENYDALTASLAATSDITRADDDLKDELKDNCADLQDDIDSDRLDDFCNDLEEAVNDEDQAKFEQVKVQFAAVEPEIREAIASEVGDAVEDAEDDDPLEGGDPGNDDVPDDGLDEDDVENPFDEE